MTNIVAIKPEQHKNLKVAEKRNLQHVANSHVIPVTAREFAQAGTSYPIVMIKDPNSSRFRAVAMLGLQAGENLYMDGDKWNAIYIPQSISLSPFVLGLDPDQENTLTACVDLDSEFVGEDKDLPLFNESGEPSDVFKNIQESLGRVYEDEVLTDKFIKELEDKELLVELELLIDLASGEKKKLVGLYGIDDQKLQELADDVVLDFHKRGLFIPLHAMLASTGQINRLAQFRNVGESADKVAAIRFSVAGATES